MVKLRSRLIRSPFTGAAGTDASNSSTSPAASAASAAAATAAGAHFNNNHINFQQQRGRGIGRANSHHARQQHQRQRQVNRRRSGQGRRSQRSRMHSSNSEASLGSALGSEASSAGVPAAATSTESERRPFVSLGSSLADSPATLRGASLSSITSPGKRKPETRGITASIRRAKTAMFRIASSPSLNRSSHGQPWGGEGHVGSSVASVASASGVARASSNVDSDDEEMDTSDDEDYEDAVDTLANAETSYTSPLPSASTLPPAGPSGLAVGSNRQRTPSQEENIPPMALLSPNCGTLYAHAAGAAASTDNYKDNGKLDVMEGREDSTAMDLDNGANEGMATVAPEAAPRVKNVLEWMREDAPPELLPKLLSFCGSRRMNALGRANKAWNAIMKDEAVWRVLCEDTHKWSDRDEVPTSWCQFYKQNPVVPIDYDTVDAAFDAVSSGPLTESIENNVMHAYREQHKTCRILLHPGPYFLRRPLVANVAGMAEVTIESIGTDDAAAMDPEHGMIWQQNYHKQPSLIMEDLSERSEGSASSLSPGRAHFANLDERRPSTPTLRQIFGSCGGRLSSSSHSAALAGLDLDRRPSSSGSGGLSDYEESNERSKAYRAAFRRQCFRGPRPAALLCLESRGPNEPVVRVRRGTLNLIGLKLLHYCEGTDIWNGNAAVQVQTAFGRNGRPMRPQPPMIGPTANVVDCDITSLSGRGLVAIDGGVSRVVDCNLHDSAATGLYVGGPGSLATLERTDVVDNGVGNARNPRGGVARGHSGVYVEQGLAKILDCNVSNNTLTGISAISTEQARLHIEGSDVRSNRSDQMELPPPDSGRGVNRNNRISSTGQGRPRSRHLMDSVAAREAQGRRSVVAPSTPQSPL